MGGKDRTLGIENLCDSLSTLTGHSVHALSHIADLGVTSLEVLQMVLTIGDPQLIDVFPEFFEPLATPTSVWDAAHEA